jgi:hypothetical protein
VGGVVTDMEVPGRRPRSPLLHRRDLVALASAGAFSSLWALTLRASEVEDPLVPEPEGASGPDRLACWGRLSRGGQRRTGRSAVVSVAAPYAPGGPVRDLSTGEILPVETEGTDGSDLTALLLLKRAPVEDAFVTGACGAHARATAPAARPAVHLLALAHRAVAARAAHRLEAHQPRLGRAQLVLARLDLGGPSTTESTSFSVPSRRRWCSQADSSKAAFSETGQRVVSHGRRPPRAGKSAGSTSKRVLRQTGSWKRPSQGTPLGLEPGHEAVASPPSPCRSEPPCPARRRPRDRGAALAVAEPLDGEAAQGRVADSPFLSPQELAELRQPDIILESLRDVLAVLLAALLRLAVGPAGPGLAPGNESSQPLVTGP